MGVTGEIAEHMMRQHVFIEGALRPSLSLLLISFDGVVYRDGKSATPLPTTTHRRF
jgi:hypothetical protein